MVSFWDLWEKDREVRHCFGLRGKVQKVKKYSKGMVKVRPDGNKNSQSHRESQFRLRDTKCIPIVTNSDPILFTFTDETWSFV